MKTMRAALAALILLGVPTLAAAADPVGHYTIEGKNPDGDGDYSGHVTISRTGDTYKVLWDVDGASYVGTAIGNSHFLAVSYKSGRETGIALYAEKGDDWDGIWSYAGGSTVGTEVWTRQ